MIEPMVARSIKRQNLFRSLLLLLVLAVVVLLPMQVSRGLVVDTDLRALFPDRREHPLAQRAGERLLGEYGQRLLLGVRAADRETALAAAEQLAAAIAASDLLVRDTLEARQEQQSRQQALLAEYRFHRLTDRQRHWLEAGDHQALLRRAEAALFGVPGARLLSPVEDPLALSADQGASLAPSLPGEYLGDRLLVTDQSGAAVLFLVTLEGDSYSLAVHDRLNALLEDLPYSLTGEPQLLLSGVAWHAAEASSRARFEVMLIAIGSAIGVILLFLLAFRSFSPLLLSLGSVAFGALVAFALVHGLFGRVHLLTLVFGASLIGVVIDYSLHYLCKLQDTQPGDRSVLARILPALVLGLATSVLGYTCLLQASLPGLQQLAAFAVTGLIGAWLFVVVLYPMHFVRPLPPPAPLLAALARVPLRLWRSLGRHWPWPLAAALLLLVAGAQQWQSGADLRSLHRISPALATSERQVQQLLESVAANQFFLVLGASEAEVLEAEEAFLQRLAPLVETEALAGYQAISQQVPSPARQAANYRLLAPLYQPGGVVEEFMSRAGFAAQARARARQQYLEAEQLPPLRVDQWLAEARDDQRLLWLGESDGVFASVISLQGVGDTRALQELAQEQPALLWVDRVAEVSGELQRLQNTAAGLLLFAYAAVLLLLWLVYRRLRALSLVLVPLTSTALTLALLSASGVPIGLFHLLGCYLILGLGMDYAIFIYQTGRHDSTLRAVLLSALTSALAFGLLSFSSTPMLAALGSVLLLGSLGNWLLAPLLCPAGRERS